MKKMNYVFATFLIAAAIYMFSVGMSSIDDVRDDKATAMRLSLGVACIFAAFVLAIRGSTDN